MTILFLVLIVVACLLLVMIVLIQNPKGGGLAGNIAGFSNQFMGVKQTTDVLEKGTWIFAGVVVFLCLISALLIGSGSSVDNNMIKGVNPNAPSTAPSQLPSSQPATPQQTPDSPK
jgi:preprotein translocase subunit SecG